ncbi:MAG: hypothetical protein H6811_01640 [Phycisphaeraceae bacterium]|nr:hypothetical protein [Phycisphaeraceae bacterium]
MSHALTQYDALHGSIVSRRARPETLKGLDKAIARVQMLARHRRARLSWLMREAERVHALRTEVRSHSERALDELIETVRERFVRGTAAREDVRRGLAAVREIARRETGEEAFVVQLVGALALYHGRIVEMLTGEGKTLTGSLAAPLLAWRHRHLHVFTVNDYLARRDAHSREGIYARCRCQVGAIQSEQPPAERFDIYARSIVYGTPKQITADYLRDQLRIGPRAARQQMVAMGRAPGTGPMVPGLRSALVDEADAVLVDEGVVPLIIARNRGEDAMSQVYRDGAMIASRLDEGPDYSINHLERKAELRRRGREQARRLWSGLSDPIWKAERRAEELVRQALVARHCYIRGTQYDLIDGRVIIIDEYTGRFLHDRNWEHGLHQAVEAKEGAEVTADRETLARLSFQRFFRTYRFLCGMTGTVADARPELEKIYLRPVTRVPTNRPMIRRTRRLRCFRSSRARMEAVLDEIQRLHEQGRPVLVGTRSITASQSLSAKLAVRGLEHRVLNALHDKEEAELISDAGHAGAITVATNMAGRGTDIRLDEGARQAGGLAVLLTEMHGAKRIDRQFMGRAGRQGDPGSAQVFVSLDDELVTQNTARRGRLLGLLGGRDEIHSGRAARWVFRMAQRRNETRDRRNRANVLRQDDWIEKNLPGG